MFTDEAPYFDCPHDRHRRIPPRDSPSVPSPDPAAADAAIEEILEGHEPKLRSLARHIAGPTADVENILGSVRCKLVDRFQSHGIAPDEAPRWLNRVTRNEALDLAKRTQRQAKAYNGLRQIRIVNPPLTDPARLAERCEIINVIMAEIERLPDSDRALVFEHCVDGLSVPKIATRLGLKPSTAYKKLKTALAILHETLSPIFDDSALSR